MVLPQLSMRLSLHQLVVSAVLVFSILLCNMQTFFLLNDAFAKAHDVSIQYISGEPCLVFGHHSSSVITAHLKWYKSILEKHLHHKVSGSSLLVDFKIHHHDHVIHLLGVQQPKWLFNQMAFFLSLLFVVFCLCFEKSLLGWVIQAMGKYNPELISLPPPLSRQQFRLSHTVLLN